MNEGPDARRLWFYLLGGLTPKEAAYTTLVQSDEYTEEDIAEVVGESPEDVAWTIGNGTEKLSVNVPYL